MTALKNHYNLQFILVSQYAQQKQKVKRIKTIAFHFYNWSSFACFLFFLSKFLPLRTQRKETRTGGIDEMCVCQIRPPRSVKRFHLLACCTANDNTLYAQHGVRPLFRVELWPWTWVHFSCMVSARARNSVKSGNQCLPDWCNNHATIHILHIAKKA